MKKYILLLIIPLFGFSQSLSIGPLFSYDTFEQDLPVEQPRFFYGFKIASEINSNILISIGCQFGEIDKESNQYFPEYDGVAVPSPDNPNVYEIIGAHDEYTLTNTSHSKNLFINLLLSC